MATVLLIAGLASFVLFLMLVDSKNNKPKEAGRNTVVLFPETDITLGMTIEELIEKDPDSYSRLFDTLISPQFTQKNTTITVAHHIMDHPFWNILWIEVKNDTVQALIYGASFMECEMDIDFDPDRVPENNSSLHKMGFYTINDVVQKTESLFELLKQQLGATFEKRMVRYGKARAILFIWEREKDCVVFSPDFIPSKIEDLLWPYDSYILPTKEALEKRFPTISERVPEGMDLWLDIIPPPERRPLP